ncbi:hypothetical protein ACWD26_32685 [Streptomyces sp. NPDC002787]
MSSSPHGHVFGRADLRRESTKRLVITSYNVAADDVYLFRTLHLPALKRDWREQAVNVALATYAAPTYLPGMSLDGHGSSTAG